MLFSANRKKDRWFGTHPDEKNQLIQPTSLKSNIFNWQTKLMGVLEQDKNNSHLI